MWKIPKLHGMFSRLLAFFRLGTSDTPPSFATVLKEYIDKYIVENNLSPDTVAHYEVFYRNSANFISINKLWTLPVTEIRERHAEQFRSWLRQNLKTCTIRRASRHVEVWKRASRYALMMDYCQADHLSPIKAQRDKKNKIITLEANEIKKLMKKQFKPGVMAMAKDLFLFQCFTGLSYADIYRHQLVYRSGRYWIDGERKKSEKAFRVWVFDEAVEIYTKWEGHLPQLSNQKYNEYLKEIAGILNIDKKLTTHVGRKTFATLMSMKGVGTKAISLMLGNTERICEDHYIDQKPEIIDNELRRAGVGDSLMG